MRRRKQRRKAGYYLLFKQEDRQNVWLYEYLRKDEITARLRDGWKIVPNHSTFNEFWEWKKFNWK